MCDRLKRIKTLTLISFHFNCLNANLVLDLEMTTLVANQTRQVPKRSNIQNYPIHSATPVHLKDRQFKSQKQS
jgi:hypothetical protein